MDYSILDGKLIEGDGGQVPVHVEGYSPDAPPTDPGEIPPEVFRSAFGHSSSHFESHETFDLICYEPVNILDPARASAPVCIFMERDHMHFYCPDPAMAVEALAGVMEAGVSGLAPGGLLYYFLWRRVCGDRAKLEELENALNTLEDEVLTDQVVGNCNRRLISQRKHLLRIRRHYEELSDLVGDVAANENELFDKRALKQFALLGGKVDRLFQKAVALSDYVSQIREAYQAEVDLRLNKTMQVLTIITVIVLPLTLIAGWYGMNLQMPELALPYMYPVVLGISAAIIVGCIWYFKKHKWF